MRKTDTGQFLPKNPQKYMGDATKITYRSSWELTVMLVLDKNPFVIAWSSETLQIPYLNPVTNKWTVYIPDLLVIVDDGKNNRHVELVEIKPLDQTPGYQPGLTAKGKQKKVSKYTLIEQVKNEAKWKAALVFCIKRGWRFNVMTEQTMFGHTARKDT